MRELAAKGHPQITFIFERGAVQSIHKNQTIGQDVSKIEKK